jgi:hypothetical protein
VVTAQGLPASNAKGVLTPKRTHTWETRQFLSAYIFMDC